MKSLHLILKQNIVGKLLNHIIVFLINIEIVRISGASVSGLYFNELYLLNFFVFIFSAGLDYSAIAWISREPGLLASVHKKLFKVFLFFLSILLFVFFIIYPAIETKPFMQSALAMIFFSAGNLLLIFFQGIMSSQKRFNQQNITLITTNLLLLGFLFFFVKEEKSYNIEMISTAFGGTMLLQGLILCAISYKKTEGEEHKLNPVPFYRYGITIMFSSVIYFAFLRMDNFFVEKYCSAITLSNYVQCGKLGQYFIYFSSVISSTLLPFISSGKIGSSYDEWKKFMTPYILLIITGAILMALSGNFIYPLIFGIEFSEMNNFMLIFLPGFVCLGILTLINAVYIGKGNIRRIFRGDLIGMLSVLALDIIFIPTYGAKAAAIISSFCYCMVFLYLLQDLKKQFPVNGNSQ